MKASIRELLDKVNSVPDFLGVTLHDINDTNSFGDNALHCVCVWGDFDAAKLLVENGINIEQRGEGGFTPLKVANDFGHKEIVSYLIAKGANSKALSNGFNSTLRTTPSIYSDFGRELVFWKHRLSRRIVKMRLKKKMFE